MNVLTNEAATDADSFVEKWRRRWPEWNVARVFVPAHQRELAEHWFALLQEWGDAASTAEPAPGLAKLAWWQEELRGWAKGARRHPLAVKLQKTAVDWNAIAAALPALATRDHVDADAMKNLARALSDAEQNLFDEARDGSKSIERGLRALLHAPDADTPSVADAGTRPRRLIAAIERARQDPSTPASPWQTLRCSWRAARS